MSDAEMFWYGVGLTAWGLLAMLGAGWTVRNWKSEGERQFRMHQSLPGFLRPPQSARYFAWQTRIIGTFFVIAGSLAFLAGILFLVATFR